MKKIFLTLLMFFAVFAVAIAQNDQKESDQVKKEIADAIQEVAGPQIEFEEKVADYGTFEKGADPFKTFSFVNTGTEPLIIKNAKGSCGCTVPSVPKEPIMPGESGEIKVRYDTNRTGSFTKTIRVTTNTDPATTVLTIKGKVATEPQQESAPSRESIFKD